MSKTISLTEVYSKYQPIKKSTSKWELDTLVTVILKRYTTATGKVTYLVKFRDGSTSKVSARSLYKRNADLVETFEHKRLLALESPEEEEDDDHLSLKRTYTEHHSPSPSLKKAKRKSHLKKAKSATPSPLPSTSRVSSSLRSSSLPPEPKVQIILKRPLVVPSIHSNTCYHCSKRDCQGTAKPLVPCDSCTFSFHPPCNDNEVTCLLCRTHGSGCMLCNKHIQSDDEKTLMFRCKQCSRAMHEACTEDDDDQCRDCQVNRDKMIEKCLGERNDRILVKWRNQSYGCIEWVPRTWVEFKYPEVYKDYLTSDFHRAVDKEEFNVDCVLDVVWHDRNEPNHVLLLYKNMKKEEAVWEAPPKQNQAYEEALKVYKESNKDSVINRTEHNDN